MIPIGVLASQITQVGGVQVTVVDQDPPPTVVSVAPAVSDLAGGDTVYITGTGFIGGAPTVTFGGTAATSIEAPLDSETIRCVIPDHVVGAVDVVVTLTGGGTGTGTGVFTYQAISATSITPATGTIDGGTAFSIAGTGFAVAGETITFDDGGGAADATSIVRVSSLELTGVSPAGDAGTADVLIGGSEELTAAFTYSAVVSYPNEPAGATPVSAAVPFITTWASFVATDNPATETDAQPFWYITGLANTSNVTDATAPLHTGANQVGRVHFTDAIVDCATPPGAGNTTAQFQSEVRLKAPSNAVLVYDSFWFRISGTNPLIYVNGVKFWNAWNGSNYTSILEIGNADDGGAPPWDVKFVCQDGSDTDNVCDSSRIIAVDTWYQVETIINYSTKQHTIFVDGVQVAQGTNTALMGNPGTFEWGWVYGGGPCQGSGQDWYMYHDEHYRSYTT